MRVLLTHAIGPGATYYRIEEPARAVSDAGLGIEVAIARGIGTTMREVADGSSLEVTEVDAQGADVVVLQTPKTDGMLQTMRVLQAQGVAVVVEIDDLLSGVPYGHMGHDALVRHRMGEFAFQAAREADLVTASTPALLQEYARHGRGVVIENAIPRRVAELPPAYERESGTVTIGWTGNVMGHPYDLQEMGSGLQQALDRSGSASRLLVLGQKWDLRTRLGLSEEPDEVPWLIDVDAYLERMGELFDIGIAPLRIDRFNTCKSWLKPLEYSARGVYSVRARTDEYERLGLGMPARAPKDWAKWLTRGVQDADRRREVAAAARERVLAQHLTEHTAERWAAAWRSARDNRTRALGRGRLATAAG
ncbi:glycosyltransferase family 4 protein [Blastococcus sp. KM273128]|uniref:glycosyltransferase family protein n=1 Tax=Blastococcus sp. KM273128 TaxID=2570314 RepID=UPI001F3DC214|nr:glycosyltransferase [Blastococcus sp. KM273128]MCF6745837.1 glycosyltransferase family 4 protein [Blastococcus sp. KM273128]